MKPIKLRLLPKVLIAIVLGIAFSFISPDWLSRIFVTFSSLFSNLLGMFIPLLIIGLIAPGIGDIGKGAGKLLLITALIAYLSTILSGFFSYFSCREVFPLFLRFPMGNLASISETAALEPYFTFDLPPVMSVTTALVLSFMLGIGLTMLKGDSLKNLLTEFREFIFLMIHKLIIPLLPLYIFSLFLQIGAEGKVASVLGMFFMVIIIIFVLHILLLIIQFCIAGAIAHKNPFKALLTMLPAYATALGTQSSAATIPVTVAQVKKNGVHADVADFAVPLCATIHLAGSILKIVACAYAISLSMSMPVGFDVYGPFILMLGVMMIAAPGVPGGAIMAAIGLISTSLGFDANLQGLMIALYIAMDSFGTAANVTGDGAIALIVNKISQSNKS